MNNTIANSTIRVKYKTLVDNVDIPFYATDEACGMDVKAVSCIYNKEGDFYEYHTGLAFEIPPGYMMKLAPRSSNRKTDCYMPNSIGWIDADYRGEVLVCFKHRRGFRNFLRKLFCNPMKCMPYEIGDRIAQIMVIPYPKVILEESNELSNTNRGTGGHGSTGK